MTPPRLFVVSDGRGETGMRLLRSALVQFEGRNCEIRPFGDVRSPAQVEEIVNLARQEEASIFYTLVATETREAMRALGTVSMVPCVDLLGPTLSALHDVFKSDPVATPGLFYESDREYFDRMDAIDYTLKHDDGQRPEGLDRAHVVLVGVSRSSKSSTCFFLGYHGIRAANVPLIPGIPPPRPLLELPAERVIGLSINLRRLMTVREVRARHLRSSAMDQYLEERAIVKELRYANDLVREQGWRSVDVSYHAIEEVAREIIELRGLPISIPR